MTQRSHADWEVRYDGWDPAHQATREALLTLGNGHFATRGALEESVAGGAHYPGTYLAGGFDRATSEVAGHLVENEDLVNWPNWLSLTYRCADGEWFDLERVTVLEHVVKLDLFRGVLKREVRFRDPLDREFRLESRRIVHMAHAHLAAMEWVLTPLDWTGPIEIRSAIDGGVSNCGVARYQQLEGRHLEVVDCGAVSEEVMFLEARTLQSKRVMAQAARTRAWLDGVPAPMERRVEVERDWVAHHLFLTCEAGRPVQVQKVVALYGSRDFAISEPRVDASDHLWDVPDFAPLLEDHERAWRRLWRRADLRLGAREDPYEQMVLRLHVFHLLQTTSPNTIGLDVGMPARGLHGEAYRGHIFWDEVFSFPYLNLRIPELTKSLLMYRYRRLPKARRGASEAGYRGAMFPWQSGSNGREESQVLHLNPESGRWVEDNTHRQRHVNAAIAYNVWRCYEVTGDAEFLSFYGAEMLLDIAHFWSSIATFDAARGRYEIHGVVGPDEFHTQDPHSERPALSNNAYTNVMAAWVLKTALDALDHLVPQRRAELLEALRISDDELRRWDDVSRRLHVPFLRDGIIAQFEGWDRLEELDWEALRERHGDIQRLDRILEAEGRDPNQYKASKQADVLMLLFLFSAEELGALMGRLGYDFEPKCIPRNVEYYLARTSHGSTLSRVVHAWVLARSNRKESWNLFREALASDIDDIQGGSTSEGIHLGAMAGTVDLVQRCYTGIETRDGMLWLHPRLPAELQELHLSVQYRGIWLQLQVNHRTLNVVFEQGPAAPARIGVEGRVHEMAPGEEWCFDLRGDGG